MKTYLPKLFLIVFVSIALSFIGNAENKAWNYSTSISTSLTNAVVASAVPAALDYVFVTNYGPAQEILFFDAIAVPANGAVTPKFTLLVATGESKSIDFDGFGFDVGISICNSTTSANPFSKTLGAADCFFLVRSHKP